MTNEQLIEISRSVDSYMSTLLIKYDDLTPLSLAAVLLARTMVLNNEAGSVEDFFKLARNISQNPSMGRNETQVH